MHDITDNAGQTRKNVCPASFIATTRMTTPAEEIGRLLDRLRIPYQSLRHAPILTMEEGREIARTLQTVPCKNLLLCNRQHAFFLCLLPGEKRVSLQEIARQAGSSRLSFAPEEALRTLLRTVPGAVSPLGLLYDTEKQVRLLIDREIVNAETIGCHPCSNTYSLKIRTKDLLDKLLPEIGHADYRIIS